MGVEYSISWQSPANQDVEFTLKEKYILFPTIIFQPKLHVLKWLINFYFVESEQEKVIMSTHNFDSHFIYQHLFSAPGLTNGQS